MKTPCLFLKCFYGQRLTNFIFSQSEPFNHPPHLKQPPSPNLPFSPSESIHQIIYPSNTRKACLPRQGIPFTHSPLALNFIHSCINTFFNHLAIKCGSPAFAPKGIHSPATAAPYLYFLSSTSTIHPPNTHKACLPRQGFSIFSIKLHPHPFSHQMRLARICPCKSRATSPSATAAPCHRCPRPQPPPLYRWRCHRCHYGAHCPWHCTPRL